MFRHYLTCLYLIVPLLGVSVCEKTPQENSDYNYVQKWPKYNKFGQISGVGVDAEGNIFLFHRGKREWNFYSFQGNVFAEKDEGPIPTETVIVIEPKEGSLLTKAAANFFYLPHGLTVDSQNNVWLTDVAMHQVFKFPPLKLHRDENQYWRPSLVLGTFMEPGNDESHFCKPTSVAVDKNTNDFFVADGYCNGRLIKYDALGNKLLEWGRMVNGFPKQLTGYMLSVPHSLHLDEDNEVLYVADREHFRVLTYDSMSEKYKNTFQADSRIFSVAAYDNFLFALANNNTSTKSVLVYNLITGKYIINFTPQHGFTNPHDLAISPNGDFCYVVELKPHTIWKIRIDVKSISMLIENNLNGYSLEDEKEEIEVPFPAESKVEKKNNVEVSNYFLAVGLVVSAVVISFLFFMFHYFKKKAGYRRYETRRLILDDDEGGIQLT